MVVKPGDKIRVFTKDATYEGILVPSVELIGKDTLILKLGNGYNIGIEKKSIKKTEIIDAYKPKKTAMKDIAFNPGLKTVSVLSTGGTISSKVDYRTGGVYADYTADDFIQMIPELREIANIRAKKVLSIMSEDILPKDWKSIAGEIEKEVKLGTDGIVITCGTDTLHYMAAAVSFMVEEVNIPIIFTGAQRSIDRGSSDAFSNLLCSVRAAGEFGGSGVMCCMHGSSSDDYNFLIKGTKVRKMDTSRRDAFRPINALPFAKIYPDRAMEIIDDDFQKADRSNKKKVMLKPYFEDKVSLLYAYPGFDPGIIDYHIKKGIKGIVIGATALGHVNTWTEKSLIPKLERCYKLKIPVIISSQTLYGRVDPYVYSNLRQVSIRAHGIYVSDMHPETAYIKLGWVLGQTKDYEKAKEMMLKNLRGEFSDRLLPEMFLY